MLTTQQPGMCLEIESRYKLINFVKSQLILTRGDNNDRDDGLSSLYPAGRKYARRDEVVGLVYGKVPYLGQFSLLAREKPWVLCAAIASILAVGRAL